MSIITSEYKDWIGELKQRIRQSQIKAAVKVNTELLQLYWKLGGEIVEKQQNAQWGDGFLKQLSADLMTEFPEMKGFSLRNLERIRNWYLFYYEHYTITAQAVPQFGNANRRSNNETTCLTIGKRNSGTSCAAIGRILFLCSLGPSYSHYATLQGNGQGPVLYT